MTRVEIYQDHQLIFSSPFTSESFTIGRTSPCDICLPDPMVSRVHLLIQRKNGNFTVIDKSRNGIRINGETVAVGELRPSDEIEIGSWSVKLKNSKETDEVTEVAGIQDSTCVFSYHEKSKELSIMKPVLCQTSPLQRNFSMQKNILSIGKNAGNHVIVTNNYVSNFHCRIEFRAGNFWVKDLQSTNGTFLNGIKIREALLENRSILEIGEAKFEFQLNEKRRRIEPSKNELHGIITVDEKMKQILGLIESIGAISPPVLIQGETGSGKELIAKAVHETSLRKNQSFIAVNCAAIPKELIESELFGHEKGAFTGAMNQRLGLFEQAHEGTIFLDEIGELPMELQPKLLRVLETGELRRVGGSKTIHVDVRIIAATHRDLHEQIEKNLFREDLFYRIHVLPISIPPLRERRKDISLLIRHFLNQKNNSPKKLHASAFQKLMEHSWPGNVRELKNVMERALSLSFQRDEILPEDIRFAGRMSDITVQEKPPMTLEENERHMILSTLEKTLWNKKMTAEKLGIAKSTLHDKVKKYGIQKDPTS